MKMFVVDDDGACRSDEKDEMTAQIRKLCFAFNKENEFNEA